MTRTLNFIGIIIYQGHPSGSMVFGVADSEANLNAEPGLILLISSYCQTKLFTLSLVSQSPPWRLFLILFSINLGGSLSSFCPVGIQYATLDLLSVAFNHGEHEHQSP